MSERSLAIRQAIGVEKLGEIMYKSGYFSDARTQAQAIVKILAGAELDLGPIASMNGIHIIEGKPTFSAQLIASLIQRSASYRFKVLEHDDQHCAIEFYELVGKRQEPLGVSAFSLNDAKTAGLLDRGGSMWKKYPRNMLYSRALTNGARWFTPSVFNGPVYTPDELGAEVDAEGNVIEIPPEATGEPEPYVPTREQDPEDEPRQRLEPAERMVSSADDRVWKRWLEVRDEALKYGVAVPNLRLPMAYKQLVSTATMVKAQTEDKQAQQVNEAAEQDAWAENRRLMAAAYAAGHKLRDLPSNASRHEVEVRNAELEAWLEDNTA